MPRKRVTTPPRALPLVAVSFVAIIVGVQTLSVLQALEAIARFGWSDDVHSNLGVSRGELFVQSAIDVAVLVALSLLLRLLIRRWVVRERAERPRPQ